MEHSFLLAQKLFLSIARTGVWVPSQAVLYGILVFGAFLTAGVALSVFTFYEDHYWGDKNFRDHLRLLSPIEKSPTQKIK